MPIGVVVAGVALPATFVADALEAAMNARLVEEGRRVVGSSTGTYLFSLSVRRSRERETLPLAAVTGPTGRGPLRSSH